MLLVTNLVSVVRDFLLVQSSADLDPATDLKAKI